MNRLVKNALEHLDLDAKGKKDLVKYYNENCLELVPSRKRYEMTFNDPWCSMFTSVVAHKSRLYKNEFPYGVSVHEQVKQAKKWGIYSEGLEGLKSGDLLVFDWVDDGSYDHIGIVNKAGNQIISTIEGNYSNTVKIRYMPYTARFIRGYISLGGSYTESPKRRIETLAEMVLKGEMGNGQERRFLLGSDYPEVQKLVNKLSGG